MQEVERDERRKEFFDRVAEGWEDRNYSPEQKAKVEKMLAAIGLKAGMTILDVGCGQGILLPFIRKITGESAKLIALDASAPMLKSVAEKDRTAWAIHSTAENIPLIDEYVDVAICFSAFPHFSDKTAVAREFFRVLKPGGRAYVLHIDSRDTINKHHDKHHAVEGDHLPCPNGMRIIFTEAGFSKTDLDDCEEHYYFSAIK